MKNPSIGSRVVSCGQTEEWIGEEVNMTKLIIVFRNSANAPKNENNISLGARIAQSVQ